jgi:hypothetical protein
LWGPGDAANWIVACGIVGLTMPKGPRADELSHSVQQIAVASAWSALMLGLCLAAVSLSAVKKIEIAGIF